MDPATPRLLSEEELKARRVHSGPHDSTGGLCPLPLTRLLETLSGDAALQRRQCTPRTRPAALGTQQTPCSTPPQATSTASLALARQRRGPPPTCVPVPGMGRERRPQLPRLPAWPAPWRRAPGRRRELGGQPGPPWHHGWRGPTAPSARQAWQERPRGVSHLPEAPIW